MAFTREMDVYKRQNTQTCLFPEFVFNLSSIQLFEILHLGY